MRLADAGAIVGLALIEGALVALPRADALAGLDRLRSAAWAIVLPGSVLIGTFGVLALHGAARVLVALAAIATPALAAIALLAVVRVPRPLLGRRALLTLVGTLALAGAAVAGGWLSEISDAALTALGCLVVGIAIARLIPPRLVAPALLAMCAVDAGLLALGPGAPAAALMHNAQTHFHGPSFAAVTLGRVTTDYPDLVFAAVIGGIVAHNRVGQRRAALLLTVFVAVYGLLLTFVSILPATVPLALSYIVVRAEQRKNAPTLP